MIGMTPMQRFAPLDTLIDGLDENTPLQIEIINTTEVITTEVAEKSVGEQYDKNIDVSVIMDWHHSAHNSRWSIITTATIG